jgi:phage/plasmid primase-like uncharacterized protein
MPPSATAICDGFRQAMKRAGLVPPDDIVADGKLRRFASNGEHDDDAGWYVFHGDGLPAGSFGCWRAGIKQAWCAKSETQMTDSERAQHRQQLDAIRHQRHHDEELRQAAAGKCAQRLWDQAAPAPADHPYLRRKQVHPHCLRIDFEDRLIVPVRIDGAITSLQFIDANGEKPFLPGGKTRGGCFVLGDLSKAGTILECEGYATGASLHEATDLPVVCALPVSNLMPVATQIRQQFPSAKILLCGDNDIYADGKPNTGLLAATAAAKAIKGILVMPELDGKKCDWNDIACAKGLDVVRTAIEAALRGDHTMGTGPAKEDRASVYAHLLDGPESPSAPRLPQDFRDGQLSFGVRLKGTAYVVTSDRTILTAEAFGVTDYGLGSGPLSREGIKRFLNGERPSGAELIERLEALVQRFVMLPKDAALLVAVWIMGTYLYQAFEYFPYLVLRSPEKRCGKTRLLDVISLLAFNAHQPTASPTEAQIFREPREDGGVQIYDELEGMTHDRERWSAITSVFNTGFHRGAVVARYKKVGSSQVKENFETYVPRVIASISALESTLEDRALILFLQRKSPKTRLERFSPRHLSRLAQAFRDACASFALDCAATVEGCYQKGDFAGLANLDDDRAINLWEPLVAITSVADAEGRDSTLTDRLIGLAERIGKDRAALAGDEPIIGILEVLRDCLGDAHETRIPTADLIGKVKERLGWESLSPKSLAGRLHPLGLHPSKWREGKSTVRGYDLKKKVIDELISRYVPLSDPLESATCGTADTGHATTSY